MEIRVANKKDFNQIAKILVQESSKKPFNEKYNIKTAIKQINELSNGEIYLAENNKEVMGFIASEITKDNKSKAYIKELWIKKIYQSKGVGTNLVDFIEKRYKKKGVKTIRLVSKKSSKAFNFYKKLKYKEYKDLVFMEKKIK